jgi:hypothetical protein
MSRGISRRLAKTPLAEANFKPSNRETTRTVFVLYHFKGPGYDEIARELGVSRYI